MTSNKVLVTLSQDTAFLIPADLSLKIRAIGKEGFPIN